MYNTQLIETLSPIMVLTSVALVGIASLTLLLGVFPQIAYPLLNKATTALVAAVHP
jgi:hypothetical protein